MASVSSFAVEDCKVKGMQTVFTVGGDIYVEKKAGINFKKKVATWEDCYNFAITKSKDYPASMMGTVSSRFLDRKKAAIYISFSWEFADGIVSLFNTSGKITKYSDKYEKSPYDGDMRYYSNGRVFK